MIGKLLETKKGLLIVMSIILILLLSGLSLAYFLANVAGNDKNISGSTGQAEITYNDGKEITENNLIPGWSDEKTVTVTNTGDGVVTYGLYWSCIENALSRTSDLTYSLSNDTNTVLKSDVFPTTAGGSLIENQTLNEGESKTYKIVVSYARSSEDQSIDMGKNFKGIVDVSTPGKTLNTTCP